jgi:GTP diphosphokinase / guanosine-3',5'-bis(diphosphate) 3'-diphosphatase
MEKAGQDYRTEISREAILDMADKFDNGQLFEKALLYAEEMHKDVKRKTGEPYIYHIYRTLKILNEVPIDCLTATAAVLHDVIEDTDKTYNDIKADFGEHVAKIVDGVTKLKKTEFKTNERIVESFRKMFVAMAEDLRVILIKFADRIDNLKTIEGLDRDKQIKKANESLFIYAPIADRLGIWKFKQDMEDLSFKILYPDEYTWIDQELSTQSNLYKDALSLSKSIITESLNNEGIQFELSSRVKSHYSVFKKAVGKYNRDISQIYDIGALRIIVDSVRNCYATLGIIHDIFTPISSKFKDYIATPKSNGYKSLHTTIFGPGKTFIEIQIRTEQMHEEAENGVAAHFAYNQFKTTNFYKKGKGDSLNPRNLEWVSRLANADINSFNELTENDVFKDIIFIFTPKGDCIELPDGSTVIDAAYKIHSSVGDRCVGAKINKRIVELNCQLSDGDLVEIITGNRKGPAREWLNFVTTGHARRKIQSSLRKFNREELYEDGVKILEQDLSVLGETTERKCIKYLRENSIKGFSDFEALMAALGGGLTSTQRILSEIPFLEKTSDKKRRKSDQSESTVAQISDLKEITVEGSISSSYVLASCCKPSRYDKLVGFLSLEKGLVIHRADCKNLDSLDHNKIFNVSFGLSDNNIDSLLEVHANEDEEDTILIKILKSAKEKDVRVLKVQANKKKVNNITIYKIKLHGSASNIIKSYQSLKNLPSIVDVKSISRG